MFFPKLKRRPPEEYYNRLKQNYADYRRNLEKITEDCQSRCIYCDTLLSEMGYEGFQLDHFRPQAHFPQLATDPFNLVLSCPKCNVLKSDDWPAAKVIGAPSHNNSAGYIDSFSDNPSNYFSVLKDGEVTALKAPASYVLTRLSINRASRKKIRRARQINSLKNQINQQITILLSELHQKMAAREIDFDSAAKQLQSICSLKSTFDSIK